MFAFPDATGNAGPSPRSADVAFQAVLLGEELGDVHRKNAVFAFKEASDGFNLFRGRRYIVLVGPHGL
ncbi:MAG: hypothetical protein KKB37_09120 [Alphaproteobacteria bacterium]|nr:hypothetical protein [Alphaproteobacteria bacterium]